MGIPMGIPLFQAKKLADMSEVTLFSSNFTLYRDISSRVMQTLAAAVGDTEVYSIDEAFFQLPERTTVAELSELRAHITHCTGIPVSIGVGASKTIAKIASELGKQGDGAVVVPRSERAAWIDAYPCAKVWNTGRATSSSLTEYGISTVGQLVATERSFMADRFGVAGARLYDELSGTAVYQVADTSRVMRQSITSSRSFAETIISLADLESAVIYHLEQVGEKLRQQDVFAGRIMVEMLPSRHGDFALQGSRITVECTPPTQSTQSLLRAVVPTVRAQFVSGVPYKKAGVTASSLMVASCLQEDLWHTHAQTDEGKVTLDAITDRINARYGQGTVRSGAVQPDGSRASAKLRSPAYTTSWKDIPSVQ